MNEEGHDLLIFGATRNTGLSIAAIAREKKWSVAAMVREGSDSRALEKIGVRVLTGDAFNLEDCQDCVRQAMPRRVVSTLGGKDKSGRRIDACGNIHVIQACDAVQRFVLVTSMGCGEQFEHVGEQARKFLGEAMLAKTAAEQCLKETRLPWTILRPCGLNNEPPTGRFCLLDTPDRKRSVYLPRADVAVAVFKILEEAQWLHRVLTLQGETESSP